MPCVTIYRFINASCVLRMSKAQFGLAMRLSFTSGGRSAALRRAADRVAREDRAIRRRTDSSSIPSGTSRKLTSMSSVLVDFRTNIFPLLKFTSFHFFNSQDALSENLFHFNFTSFFVLSIIFLNFPNHSFSVCRFLFVINFHRKTISSAIRLTFHGKFNKSIEIQKLQ